MNKLIGFIHYYYGAFWLKLFSAKRYFNGSRLQGWILTQAGYCRSMYGEDYGVNKSKGKQ